MNVKKGSAIILRKTIYSDADLIFELFTKEEGKISVLAKGIRKQKAKNKGTMHLFSEIEYEIFSLPHSQNFWRIKNSSSLTRFSDESFQAQVICSLLAEVSVQFLSDNHEHSDIYDLWQDFLIQKIFTHNSALGFIIKFFSELGFFPEFSHASDCQTPFTKNNKIFWECDKGLFTSSQELTNYKTLSFSLIKVFNFCAKPHVNFSDIEKISFSQLEKKELWNIIWWFYSSHTKFFPRSKKIFEEEYIAF